MEDTDSKHQKIDGKGLTKAEIKKAGQSNSKDKLKQRHTIHYNVEEEEKDENLNLKRQKMLNSINQQKMKKEVEFGTAVGYRDEDKFELKMALKRASHSGQPPTKAMTGLAAKRVDSFGISPSESKVG